MNAIGPLGGERAGEEIGARVAVHVAADRQAEEIEDGRRDVDDRAALAAAGLDGGAVRERKPSGARSCVPLIGIAEQPRRASA